MRRQPSALDSASDLDKLEDEYWHAVSRNNRLRKARDAGYLTEEGYRMLRDDREYNRYSEENNPYERRSDSLS